MSHNRQNAKIALIGAMQEEVELILQEVEQRNSTYKAGIEFVEGDWQQHQVVVCKSGVGKVNAAVCTQILIDVFHADRIIFTGVAGALHPELNIGDIVISTECLQHDIDASALGFARGEIPYAPQSIFPADPSLIQCAYDASRRLFSGNVMKGRVLSGDQFIANRETVKQLYESMNGVCTEMEGAAVAQVCAMNEVPFVIIRSISDKADGSAHVNFAEFISLASRNSFLIVKEMLNQMK